MDHQQALRIDLDAIIDEHRFVPHRHRGIGELATQMKEQICESHFSRSPTNLGLEPRTPDTFAALREDSSHVRSYAQKNGVPATSMRSGRFDGTWCLWTLREDVPERQTLSTRSAIDAPSALRANLHEIIGESFAHSPRRDQVVEEHLTRRLCHAVEDWEATLKGHVTPRTFGDDHIRALGRDPEHRAMATAALKGDIIARRDCLSEVRYRDIERDLDRNPNSATWSLWTSKAHPQDSRLVLTNSSLEALSYHALHAHDRTRYLSFEGEPTPGRDQLLHRALDLMPRNGTLVIAADKTPEGRELASAAGSLASLQRVRVEHHEPRLMTWSSELHARGCERPSPAARLLALPAPARAAGLER